MRNSTYILIHRIIKGIADASIKIFIPLLILQKTADWNLTFLYLIVAFGLTSVFFFGLKKFIQKFKLLSIILHIVPIIIGNILLMVEMNIWIILILAVMDALSTTLYHGALNLMFVYLDKDNPNTAKFEAGAYIGKIIFALVSAYLLGSVAQSEVFIIVFSIVAYIACIIPICIGQKSINENMGQAPKLNFKEVVKDNRVFSVIHFATGITSFLVDDFVPVYIYQNGASFTKVGILLAMQYAISLAGIYFAQLLIKKKKNVALIILTTILEFAALACILITLNSTVLYVASITLTLVHNMFHILIFGKFSIDQEKKGYYQDSMFYRDVSQNASRSMMGAICLIPFAWIPLGLGYIASVTKTGLCLGYKRLK